MSDVAIQIKGLGKRYRLGGVRKGYKTLRESIVAAALTPFRRFGAASKAEDGEGAFWALKDVNFEVGQGEVIGVIGRNGAGKSTLLKVLSRITDPTEGEVDINGRVGSLLEVGTGFHPELTGRENVYLNGAILGMRRAEITRRFGEIVEFAEVERFLDTPVKYYSSGMYMRLAFAVAAHLEPEILVVDEVLAVGDMQFQKKCLGKMESVAAAGRTVLFVSHNIGAVRTLCQRVVWLESGRLKMVGETDEVTLRYLSTGTDSDGVIHPSQHIKGSGKVRIEQAGLSDTLGVKKESFLIGEAVRLTLKFKVHTPTVGSFWMFIVSSEGVVLLSAFQRDMTASVELDKDGQASVTIDTPALLPGTYTLTAGIFESSGDFLDWVEGVAKFEVMKQFSDGRPFDHRYGAMTAELTWQMGA